MAPDRFTNQVILVTGGSSGIGAATSELFIAEGAKVMVTDLVERDIIDKLGKDNASFHKCDVSSPEECEAAVKACIDKYGRLDVLFHNGGAALAPPSNIIDHDIKAFQNVINTNLCSLFYLSRAAVPQMKKQGKGAVVTTASATALSGARAIGSYAAAKAGQVNLMQTLALEHAKDNIRFNSVCPGYIMTPMTAPMVAFEGVKKAVLSRIPMDRGADPKEVGRTVLFLASDDASFLSGQPIVVDGGTGADSSASPDFLRLMAEAQTAAQ